MIGFALGSGERAVITEIIILLLLVLANGFSALSEFAVISAKRALLHQRAEKGDVRSRIALEVAEEPTRFLSTIQVGITFVGILAGAFGGATIATEIAGSVESIPAPGDHFVWDGLRFEVVDMDGNRVDKLLVTQLHRLQG